MHVVVLVLGVILGAGGVGLIGYGIWWVGAVDIGQLLIVTGSVAAVGGLIVVCLGLVAAHTRRIAQTLEVQPLPRVVASEVEITRHAPTAAPISADPFHRIPERRQAPSRPADSVAAIEAPAPRRDPMRDEPPVRMAAAAGAVAAHAAAAVQPSVPESPVPESTVPQPRVPEVPVPEPSVPEPALSDSRFEQLWPREGAAAQGDQRGDGAALPHPSPRIDVPPASGSAPHRPEGAEPAVFKAGIIDGMAYTLYTDGSIEAELPGGTVRFASVEQLSAYLKGG